jgi:Holliday junction resolvase-like predicted endonuclease
MHSNNWTGESWHSLAKMANELHMDPRTVRRALQELTDQGLIARVQRSPRAPTYTYLRPLARNRPLTGKALEEIAETILERHGFSIVKQGVPLPTTRRQADFLVVNADGEQRLVKVKYRLTLDDLMIWATVARRAQLGLIMIAAEPWDRDVEMAATDMDVALFTASRNESPHPNEIE